MTLLGCFVPEIVQAYILSFVSVSLVSGFSFDYNKDFDSKQKTVQSLQSTKRESRTFSKRKEHLKMSSHAWTGLIGKEFKEASWKPKYLIFVPLMLTIVIPRLLCLSLMISYLKEWTFLVGFLIVAFTCLACLR